MDELFQSEFRAAPLHIILDICDLMNVKHCWDIALMVINLKLSYALMG
jgi:hypothetical protein